MNLRSEPRSVSILGATRNTQNYGVLVLLSSALETLATAFPHAELHEVDYRLDDRSTVENLSGKHKKIHLIPLRYSWRLHLPNNIFRLLAIVIITRPLPRNLRSRLWAHNTCLHRLLSTDVHFSISGGDSFSDIYGFNRFLYVSLPQLLIILLGKPLVQLPQTYGPFRGIFTRIIARIVLKNSTSLFSRDQAGSKIAAQLLSKHQRPVHVVPDLGFRLRPKPLPTAVVDQLRSHRERGPIIGLNPSRLCYIGGYTGKNMFGFKQEFPELISGLIDNILLATDATILLVPHVCGDGPSQEDERRLCHRLQQQYQTQTDRVIYIPTPLDHKETKGLIGNCTLFIGARMHACIAALSQAIPTVCLAYSAKFEGVIQPLGAGAAIVDLRFAEHKDVFAAAQRLLKNHEQLSAELATRLESMPDVAPILRGALAPTPSPEDLLSVHGSETVTSSHT